nr:glycosyltransferase family 4 protein [Micromonospora sp. DSM 115978]
MSAFRPVPAGRRVLLVSRHDVRHRRVGGVEHYLYEIARRWVADGAEVTWAVTRPGHPTEETVAGVRVLRAGASFRTFARLAGGGARFDAVLDATGGLTGALPLVTGSPVPVVEVVHRVRHRTAGLVGHLLGGPLGRWNRTDRAVVALSPSARHDLRRRHRVQGPIFIVPPGTSVSVPAAAGERAGVPTVVVDADLVAEERIDLLLRALPAVVAALPGLRVEILGDGPELARLRRLAGTRLAGSVTLHGRVTDEDRDGWLRRAWLTVTTTDGEVCGSRLLTAAAYGVPSVALEVPGARDFVRIGRTGDVVDSAEQLPAALVGQLTSLGDDEVARRVAGACRSWAERFTWERSAALLAGVVEHRIRAIGSELARRRSARSDIATLVQLPEGSSAPVGALRPTDEVMVADGQVSLLLNGCDEFDARGVLARLGVTGALLRLAGHDDLLVGPHPLPSALAGRTYRRPFALDRR